MQPTKLFVESLKFLISPPSLVCWVLRPCLITPLSVNLISGKAFVCGNFEKKNSKIRFRQKALCSIAVSRISKHHKITYSSSGDAWNRVLLLWFCHSNSQGQRKSVATNFKHLPGKSLQICDVCWSLILQFSSAFWRKRILEFIFSKITSLKGFFADWIETWWDDHA